MCDLAQPARLLRTSVSKSITENAIVAPEVILGIISVLQYNDIQHTYAPSTL